MPREWLLAIAVAAFSYALVIAVRGAFRRWRVRRRFARGAEGEREAVGILEAHGFSIEAAQVSRTYALAVDAASVPIAVRADYLVSRGGVSFVAEVKTGKVAPKVETSATRRQLLEYQYVFGVDGVVLVDADARSVRIVRFEVERAARDRWFVPFAVALVAAVVLVASRFF